MEITTIHQSPSIVLYRNIRTVVVPVLLPVPYSDNTETQIYSNQYRYDCHCNGTVPVLPYRNFPYRTVPYKRKFPFWQTSFDGIFLPHHIRYHIYVMFTMETSGHMLYVLTNALMYVSIKISTYTLT